MCELACPERRRFELEPFTRLVLQRSQLTGRTTRHSTVTTGQLDDWASSQPVLNHGVARQKSRESRIDGGE
jgi:hypothetical protein